MRLQTAAIGLSLCAAVLAVPINNQRNEKRIFPWLIPNPPDEGLEPEPELPFPPGLPFPHEPSEPGEGIAFPFLPGLGEGRCGESPLNAILEAEGSEEESELEGSFGVEEVDSDLGVESEGASLWEEFEDSESI